jgi:ribosomal protein S18 acetylase RimI-like enzyme
MLQIRPFQPKDWPSVWAVLEPTFRRGDTYAYPPEISEADARAAWIDAPMATFVACDDEGTLCGTYYLKPNQPGLGAHVCNCGYVTGEAARGRGIASAMCEHSLREAAARGFRAMQFNLVVATNDGAIRLWKKHGFDVVAVLPGAFRHRSRGFVDALVMYKPLET